MKGRQGVFIRFLREGSLDIPTIVSDSTHSALVTGDGLHQDKITAHFGVSYFRSGRGFLGPRVSPLRRRQDDVWYDQTDQSDSSKESQLRKMKKIDWKLSKMENFGVKMKQMNICLRFPIR